jgi:hypothetical protein
MPNRPNAVVETWLPMALGALAQSRPVLAAAITAAAGRLDWVTYDAYPVAEIGEGFATGHAFASLLGRRCAPLPPDFDLGLFLIAPACRFTATTSPRRARTLRPADRPAWLALWPGPAADAKPAHRPVWNPPISRMLTKVGRHALPVPVRLDPGCERDCPCAPATDWPELEALRDWLTPCPQTPASARWTPPAPVPTGC